MLAAKGRPKVARFGSAVVTPEEYKSIASGVIAHHGTWDVNEADKTLTFRPEANLYPNSESTEVKGTIISLEGDNLKTKTPIIGNAVWRRVR